MTVQSTILSGLATIFIMFIGWIVFDWIKSRYVDSYYEVRKINKKLIKYNSKKKYILVGGYISRMGWDYPFVPAWKLCKLYGLNPHECYFVDPDRPSTFKGLPDLPVLIPKVDGDYSINKESLKLTWNHFEKNMRG